MGLSVILVIVVVVVVDDVVVVGCRAGNKQQKHANNAGQLGRHNSHQPPSGNQPKHRLSHGLRI